MTDRQFIRAFTLLCAIIFGAYYLFYMASEIAESNSKPKVQAEYAPISEVSEVQP